MSVWYYADAGNTRQGPVDAAELVRLRLQGELTWASLVWRDGMGDWQPMRDFASELAQADDRGPMLSTSTGSVVDAGEPAMAAAASAEPASPYAPPTAAVTTGSAVVQGGEVVYAGFWKRVAAYLIDSIVLGAVGMVVGMVLGVPLALMAGGSDATMGAGLLVMQLLLNLVSLAISVGYYAWFHASNSMATPGKMAVGIKVVRTSGERITLARGIGRFFALIPSGLILGIGFLMAGFTERKQGLHDMICDTLVVDKWAFTDRPDLQRRELGVVTWVVLIVVGGLSLLAIVALIALAAAFS